jgi:hypothetical protein
MLCPPRCTVLLSILSMERETGLEPAAVENRLIWIENAAAWIWVAVGER